MPYKKNIKHISLYLNEKTYIRVIEIATAEKKSMNKIINDLLTVGMSKRDENIFGLDEISRSIKADLQLMRDEMTRQSNRISTLLTKSGLHAIAGRYQIKYLHSHLVDKDSANQVADSCWNFAVQKLKETNADDPKE